MGEQKSTIRELFEGKMSQSQFKVHINSLTYQEDNRLISIEVGTLDWFEWLAKTVSFSYVSESGNFTARKELLGSPHKSWYWKAYRKSNRKLYRVHLGKDADLTSERLIYTAQELSKKIGQEAAKGAITFESLPLVETLVTTKLHIPQSHNALTRPRLLNSLKKAKNARLTLVSAPLGFGKTILVADWLGNEKENKAVWFSIDEADNDPARFWRYFTQALAGLPLKTQKDWLDLPPNLAIEQVLAHLINNIASFKEDFFLVLDDYHLITSEVIHRNLAYFLDRVSDHCHLVLISRASPPLPLARLRAHNQIVEIKESDLRFNAEEISHYLASAMNVQFTSDKIAALEFRTEGWIAALQMLVLSMQGRKDFDKFINSFTGSHPYLLDYLTAEVLARLPKEEQEFLLKTSILELLTDELVEAVTGCANGQTLLETLEQSNLFLIRLDEERDWFRYHHLFKEYLYKRLQQNFSNQIPDLHHKAAEWYARKNFPKDAITHYLKAQEFEQASRLIRQTAQSMLMQGEIYTLENWLNALPPEIYQQQPDLFLVRGWVFATNGQIQSAEELLKSSLIEKDSGETAAIKTMLAILHLDLEKVFEMAGQHLEYLPETTPFLRDFKLMIEAVTADLDGNLLEAKNAYTRALNSSHKSGNILVSMISMGQLGDLLLQQGQLKQAVEFFKEVIAITRPVLSHQPTLWTAPTYMGMFEALYEWNKLDEAGHYAEEANQLAEKYENGLFLIFGKVVLARYMLGIGQKEKALELIQAAQPDNIYEYTIISNYASLYRVQILIACGKRGEVLEWLEDFEATHQKIVVKFSNVPVILELQDVILSQTLIYLGKLEQAIPILTRRIETSRQEKRQIWVIRSLVLLAIVYYKKQAIEKALSTLEEALRLAEPEEIIRSFVEADPCMAILLEKLKARPLSKALLSYISRLLKVIAERNPLDYTANTNTVEPLTERELEVINLLRSGLTNKELASKLVISVGTVTWHLKNLYAKLEVRNRTEAINRARELNLFNP